MTTAQILIAVAAIALVWLAACAALMFVFMRIAERNRRESWERFHANRSIVDAPLRAKGNRDRFSLTPERTKNDG